MIVLVQNNRYQNVGFFNQDCPGFMAAKGARFYPGFVLPSYLYNGIQTEDLISIQRVSALIHLFLCIDVILSFI